MLAGVYAFAFFGNMSVQILVLWDMDKLCYLQEIPYFFLMLKMS